MNKLYSWAQKKVQSKYALSIFAILTFIESFWFMPTTTLYLLYGVAKPKKSFLFATIAVIASILGAIAAYGLGSWLCELGVAYWFLSPEKFKELGQLYAKNAVWAVFSGSLLPLPLKIVTLTAGFFKIPFFKYILSIAAGRALRFYLLAGALYLFGEQVQKFLEKYFYYFLALAVIFLIIVFFYLYR